jgi:rare lipoprotein A
MNKTPTVTAKKPGAPPRCPRNAALRPEQGGGGPAGCTTKKACAKRFFSINTSRSVIGLATALLLFTLGMICPAAYADTQMTDSGDASWYGTTAHGKITANGEIFNRYNLTAAHKSLPFGLVLRVYNLKNGQTTLVRVNDRGPYIKGRMLDVSRRAADALKMLNSGVTHVAYEVISDRKGVLLNKDNAYFVHLADVDKLQDARDASDHFAHELGRPIKILSAVKGKTQRYALCLGPFHSFAAAQKEFLRGESESVSLLGIVEAPAQGGELPQHAAPGKLQAGAERPKAPAGEDDVHYGELLHTIWGQSLKNGARFLDLALGAISGIQSNQPVFRLQYSVIAGVGKPSS